MLHQPPSTVASGHLLPTAATMDLHMYRFGHLSGRSNIRTKARCFEIGRRHSLLYPTDPFFPADIQQQLPERGRSRLVLTRATTKQGEQVSRSLVSVLPNEEVVKVQLDFETLLGNTNSVPGPQSDALANDVVFYLSMN